jgi:hypothetical protein
MVTININTVLQIMQQKQISFFKVFDVTGKNLSYIQDNEEVTPAEAFNELKDYLQNLEPGIVTIIFSEQSFKEKNKGGAAAATKNYTFKARVGNTTNLNQPTINGLNEDYKELLKQNYELQNKIMLLEHQKHTDEATRKLEEKIEGLKNEDALEKYAPLLTGLFARFMPGAETATAAPAINGLDEEQQPTKKTIITNAINRLLKVDANLAENLTLLADFAEKAPQKYKSFVPMLKMM